jgi:xanthine dehydrogenase accessory factor
MTPPDRAVIDALRVADDASACLALVLETEGSTYVGAGAMAWFGARPRQVGWLSGGCIEDEIGRRAREAAIAGRIGWLQIDTRDDEDLLSGSALGCRGRLRLALLPLALLTSWPSWIARWWEGHDALRIELDAQGRLVLEHAQQRETWRIAAEQPVWTPSPDGWRLNYAAPPRLALFGAGPETPALFAWLRSLGWFCVLVENRERWRASAALADAWVERAPTAALADPRLHRIDAALVMHHHFERDREALAALATRAVDFVGLLGPVRRREDLWRVLPASARAALEARLHSPVGLDLGGRGADAIALSIAAELQAWRHAR